jgi:hypothetical protein
MSIPPVTGNLLFPPGVKTATMSLSLLASHSGVTRDLASDVYAPPSIKLMSLSLTPGSFLVLKLSKHRDLGLQGAAPHAIKQIMSFRGFR